VLQVADKVEAEMIALGWSQELGDGRAAVVREVLERSAVPVLRVAPRSSTGRRRRAALSGVSSRAGG
jgi:hypothetical protein